MGDDQQAAARAAIAAPRSAEAERRKRFDLLHHPWRIRILDVLVERNMSVSQFVDERLIPDLPTDRGQAISNLAYHFRVLRSAGALEVVEQNPRRGSTELVCRACARAYLNDAEWAQLPVHKRQALSEIMLHACFARIERAIHDHTFDSRPTRHLAWLAMELDEQGWSQVTDLLNRVLEMVIEINRRAKERLRDTGEAPIRTTWGQLHFESPPTPAPPASD